MMDRTAGGPGSYQNHASSKSLLCLLKNLLTPAHLVVVWPDKQAWMDSSVTDRERYWQIITWHNLKRSCSHCFFSPHITYPPHRCGWNESEQNLPNTLCSICSFIFQRPSVARSSLQPGMDWTQGGHHSPLTLCFICPFPVSRTQTHTTSACSFFLS